MRIGIFDPYLDTLSGGEKYMLSAALCLSSEHEVSIFWDEEAVIKRTASKKFGMDLSKIKFYKNIFSKNVSTAHRFLESLKFDAIIYLSDGSIPFVGTKLFVHFQFPIEWVDGKSIKLRTKLAFVRKIFCNSYFTKNLVDKKLSVISDVLYPPIILRNNKNTKKENIILHVGRFAVDSQGTNYKKQDVMINLFKKMVDRGLKDWQLVLIIGVKAEDSDKTYRLKEIAKDYRIKIIENPTDEVLWEYYSKAKIYWHASGYGEDLSRYPEKAEHFGMSTVEAMGSGAVPVVISAGGQKEIVEDGKNGFLWNTLEEFSDKTTSLITNKKLLETMSIQAIKSSAIFSSDKFCEKLKNIIKQ